MDENVGGKEREWRGKSCGEILRRSGGQVCKPPPPPSRGRGQLVSWPAGAIGAEAGPLGGSRRGQKPVANARTVAIISNYGNSYRLFWW